MNWCQVNYQVLSFLTCMYWIYPRSFAVNQKSFIILSETCWGWKFGLKPHLNYHYIDHFICIWKYEKLFMINKFCVYVSFVRQQIFIEIFKHIISEKYINVEEEKLNFIFGESRRERERDCLNILTVSWSSHTGPFSQRILPISSS